MFTWTATMLFADPAGYAVAFTGLGDLIASYAANCLREGKVPDSNRRRRRRGGWFRTSWKQTALGI
jgi:hypothetical protein